jgi:predicted metal-binding protein
MEKWIEIAKECGFSEAAPMDPATCKPMQMVRDACAADKCHAYGHNWTCPPECGTLEECTERMQKYQNGILLQTVGQLRRDIDTKGYMLTEQQHMEAFHKFADEIRKEYPDALCLGAGGCRICKKCAYPEPCRFPEKACSSMEAYGLFVTQVCRDNEMKYYYGPRTIAYTACVLF